MVCLRRSIFRPGPARVGGRIRSIGQSDRLSDETRETTLSEDGRHRTDRVLVDVSLCRRHRRRCPSSSPSSSSSRATTMNPHGPAAADADEACRSASRREMILRGRLCSARLRDDFAAFAADKARTGYAQRPRSASLFSLSSLGEPPPLRPRAPSAILSSSARPPGVTAASEIGGAPGRAHTRPPLARPSKGVRRARLVAASTLSLRTPPPERIMTLSPLTNRRTLPALDIGYCRLSWGALSRGGRGAATASPATV